MRHSGPGKEGGIAESLSDERPVCHWFSLVFRHWFSPGFDFHLRVKGAIIESLQYANGRGTLAARSERC